MPACAWARRGWKKGKVAPASALAGHACTGGSGCAHAGGEGHGMRRCSLRRRKKRKGKVEADRKKKG